MSDYKKCNQCGRIFNSDTGGADFTVCSVGLDGREYKSARLCDGCLTGDVSVKAIADAIEPIRDLSRREVLMLADGPSPMVEPMYGHHYCGISMAGVCTCGLLFKLLCLGKAKACHLYPDYEKEMERHNATLSELGRMHDRAVVGLLRWPEGK